MELAPNDIRSFLDRECRCDDHLRSQVERLLQACERGTQLLPEGRGQTGEADHPQEDHQQFESGLDYSVSLIVPGDLLLNRYEIVESIGSGGIAYWIFFAVGWCLYAKPDIINLFTGRWVAYLVLGLAISIGLAGYFERILMAGKISWFYPGLVEEEIDYPELRTKLLAASTQPDGSSDYRVIWNLLSPAY